MKVAFYTLGCKVNQYETQAIKEQLTREGFYSCDENEAADIYIINTCTVTGLADRKSRQYIRKAKKKNPCCITVVTGCFAQMNPDEAAEIDGVDIIVGTNQKNKLHEIIKEYLSAEKKSEPVKNVLERSSLIEYEETGLITSMESRSRAFIKIQEGCDRFCSYCIIPYARGSVRSRRLEDILSEADLLISKGFKELVLTGINTALYGMDKEIENEFRHNLAHLIHKISELPGDFRIRLGSLEPTVADKKYVEELLYYPKLCHHLHLSLQSGSDRILKAMNRNYDRDYFLEIIESLRAHDAAFGITTDIIVGFPGETEEDFEASVDMIKKASFVKAHIFPYSKRKGTKAADMPEQISSSVKKQRTNILMKAAEEASENFFKKNIGTYRTVLFEEYNHNEGVISGFSDNYIKVQVKKDPGGNRHLTGDFDRIYLKSLSENGMWGEVR